MVKQFLERFQLWRRERAIDFEDKFVAGLLFVIVLFFGRDVYALITTHHLPWTAVLTTVLVVAFFVLYIRRSRWAWMLLMLFAVVLIVAVPFAFTKTALYSAVGVRIFSAAFILVFGCSGFHLQSCNSKAICSLAATRSSESMSQWPYLLCNFCGFAAAFGRGFSLFY
jgi:membrane-bound ClpP family serine protease